MGSERCGLNDEGRLFMTNGGGDCIAPFGDCTGVDGDGGDGSCVADVASSGSFSHVSKCSIYVVDEDAGPVFVEKTLLSLICFCCEVDGVYARTHSERKMRS